jgi:hypothetical protein
MKVLISQKVAEIYSNVGDKEQMIDKMMVEKSLDVVANQVVLNSTTLLYFLSAVNLLNAAVKLNDFKLCISYGAFKPKVSVVADLVLRNPQYFEEVKIFYNVKERCLYIEIYGVVFSFHNVTETDTIKRVATRNERIEWPGIRLQCIAQELFLYTEGLVGNINNQKMLIL